VGDTIEIVSPDDAEADLLLVVTGCRTACADVSSFGDRSILFIKSKEDAEKFIRNVKKRQGGLKADGMGENL
jgi:hypothetical protein